MIKGILPQHFRVQFIQLNNACDAMRARNSHVLASMAFKLSYRIHVARNFQGRKLLLIGKNEDFAKKTFMEQSNQSA